MKNKIHLSNIYNIDKLHVSMYVANEFIDSIRFNNNIEFISNSKINTLPRICGIIKKLSKFINPTYAGNYGFSICMGASNFTSLYPFWLCKHKALYIFDAWISSLPAILDDINKFNIEFIFVSSKQSTSILNEMLIGYNCRAYWCPEGIQPYNYSTLPVEKKTIDVLALGRRYEKLHNALLFKKFDKKYNYVYQRDGVIFPTQDGLITGLANSKIILCYPKSITDPDFSQGIETMTNRYLQGMASKVLIVGKCPSEMLDLFGYNPVVELNDDIDYVEQLIDILSNMNEYIDLIERNYLEVQAHHSWSNRWDLITSILEKNNW